MGNEDDDESKDELDSEEGGVDAEVASRALGRKRAREEASATAELRRDANEAAHKTLRLPVLRTAAADRGDGGSGNEGGMDGMVEEGGEESLTDRITAVVDVLSDFKNKRHPSVSRQEYLSQLAADLKEKHGCLEELVELFLRLLGPAECVEFMEASDRPRPVTIRTNTLKVRRKDLAQALIKRGVTLEPLASWSKVGLKIISSGVSIGATPEYLSGYYILQSASSMCPVLALDPKPGERVLDVASAPGGKATYIAQLMRNSGTLVANDMKRNRHKATVANLHRLGVHNAVCCCYDGRKLPKVFGSSFDRVLLDAPCSGLGIVSRDPSIKLQRTIKDIHRSSQLQRELLLAAIDCCKQGGTVVYSTCSVAVEENEAVVMYALSRRHVKIEDGRPSHGRPGLTRWYNQRFHPSIALSRRFFPHVHNMDGFFVTKFLKVANGPKGGSSGPADASGGDINENGAAADLFFDDSDDVDSSDDEKTQRKKRVKAAKKRARQAEESLKAVDANVKIIRDSSGEEESELEAGERDDQSGAGGLVHSSIPKCEKRHHKKHVPSIPPLAPKKDDIAVRQPLRLIRRLSDLQELKRARMRRISQRAMHDHID